MERFEIEAGAPGERCYVRLAGTPLRIELDSPADYQHAWRVAVFLNENVRDIVGPPRRSSASGA